MKTDTIINNKQTITIAIILIIVAIMFTYAYWHPVDNLTWCMRHKPMTNVSHFDGDMFLLNNPSEKISKYCYGELWDEYCKYSYPDHCP